MSVRGWKGDAIARKVKAEEKKRLARAAGVVRDHAKELLNVSGTTKSGKAERDKRGRFLRQYGISPSAPGEPPHKQYGRLRLSVTWEHVTSGGQQAVRVGPSGYPAKYGRYLEKGTSRMKARPWLVRAFRESYSRVRAILTAPIR